MPIKTKSNGISSETFRLLEKKFEELCKLYNFSEVILPMIEFQNLYIRSVGEESDIVQKEMFALKSEKDSLVLRPEGTAGVIRSYVQNKLYVSPDETVKLFYKGSMFRYERPQSGIQREFTQLGVEAIGSNNVYVEVEIISLANQFLASLGLKNVELLINSIGCNTCRTQYKKELLAYLQTKSLCELCEKRKEKNPLRVFDCKNETCKELMKDAPIILTSLCYECQDDFDVLQKELNALGIKYRVDSTLVRGLDYYNQTVFEFVETSIGVQSTICGGGRYEGLIEELGGPRKSGVGFALGLERLLISLTNQGVLPTVQTKLDYYLVWTNEETRTVQLQVAQSLRKQGLIVDMEYEPKKMKNQLKVANRKGATYALILGEGELEKKKISVKNLISGEQIETDLNDYLK